MTARAAVARGRPLQGERDLGSFESRGKEAGRMLFAIAWRNLWRNKRRTLITLSAVAGGLTMFLISNGFMHAMTDRMLEATTSTFLGHAQIHREGYRDKRSPELTVNDADRVLEAVRSTKGVVAATGRIYGLAHASIVRSDDDAAIRRGEGEDVAAPVVALLGVDARHERQVTDLAENVTEGRWLEGEMDVVVGQGLAARNDIRVGDAVLPTSADANGAMRGPWAVSDEVPRVVGIARTGMEDFDDNTIFVTRTYLAKLQRMGDQVHEIAIRVDTDANPDVMKLDPLIDEIRRQVAKARTSSEKVTTIPATAPLSVHPESSEGPVAESAASADAGLDAAAPAPARPRLRLVGLEVTLHEEEAPEAPPRAGLEGRFLTRSDDILLSATSARALEVSVGERVVVDVPVDCGPDVPAAECPPSAESFRVVGIVTQSEGGLFDGHFGLVAASVLTSNFAALNEGLVSGLSREDARRVAALSLRLRGEPAERDEVLAWYGLAPELVAMLAMMDAGPLIFLLIIFLAVSVGIVNTMLMATFERTREVGMMMALGMRPRRVVAMVMVESALLGVLGVIVGLVLGGALVGYWSVHGATIAGEEGLSFSGVHFDPTLWPRLTVADMVKASVPVFVMTTLAGLWPAYLASRLRVTEAIGRE